MLWDLAPGLVIRACDYLGHELARYLPAVTTTQATADAGCRPTRIGPIGSSEAVRVDRWLLNYAYRPLELGVYKTLPIEWHVAYTEVRGEAAVAYNSKSLHIVLSYARGGTNGLSYLEISLQYGMLATWRRVWLKEYEMTTPGMNSMAIVRATFQQTDLARDWPSYGSTQPYSTFNAYGW